MHRKDKSNALFVTTLTIALLVLAALPVGAWTIWQNQMNRPVATETSSSSESSSQLAAVSQSHKKAAKHESSETSSESSAASANSTSQAESDTASSASESTAESSSEASSESASSDATYVTVKAGQGIYRVAANNGLTVQELRQLNGLSSNSTLAPGQRLRVK
ncbi:LysM domain-containing protein [Loigolactobacillus rennini DSM 20253]|uniref:LysM domain-containing protein n=1 Tax=Loigolactobacillus rennini DSM 20253 TaxID=1423796 RepID=A0A0R2D4M7_9LACO|nr:LysM domain-containing protein [Loigolactobacillus rennini DSM 20253]